MEYLLAGSILGLGYHFFKFKRIRFRISKDKIKFKTVVPRNQKPSGDNIYTSHRSYNIKQNMQKRRK